MATYLLTWNPEKWHWWNDFQEIIKETDDEGYYHISWSCGNSKKICAGDRVFMLRQRKEPRGIFASGWATSDYHERKHWDKEKAKRGKTALSINVSLDTLLNPEELILDRRELDIGILGKMHWDSESSGISIPDDVADKLEEEWALLCKAKYEIPSFEPSAVEGIITETVRYVRGRSQELRKSALDAAQGVCSVCEVDFSKILNGQGVRVLQVHHRKQLAASDAPRITHLKDLAVVCANCHMLIHKNPKHALSVEAVKKMLVNSL
jgi:predicted HNH restriction endonuclease